MWEQIKSVVFADGSRFLVIIGQRLRDTFQPFLIARVVFYSVNTWRGPTLCISASGRFLSPLVLDQHSVVVVHVELEMVSKSLNRFASAPRPARHA